MLVIEVLPPFLVGVANHAHDVAAGVQREGPRLAQEIDLAQFAEHVIAFLRLQAWQQATRFSQVERPPRDRGIT